MFELFKLISIWRTFFLELRSVIFWLIERLVISGAFLLYGLVWILFIALVATDCEGVAIGVRDLSVLITRARYSLVVVWYLISVSIRSSRRLLFSFVSLLSKFFSDW